MIMDRRVNLSPSRSNLPKSASSPQFSAHANETYEPYRRSSNVSERPLDISELSLIERAELSTLPPKPPPHISTVSPQSSRPSPFRSSPPPLPPKYTYGRLASSSSPMHSSGSQSKSRSQSGSPGGLPMPGVNGFNDIQTYGSAPMFLEESVDDGGYSPHSPSRSPTTTSPSSRSNYVPETPVSYTLDSLGSYGYISSEEGDRERYAISSFFSILSFF